MIEMRVENIYPQIKKIKIMRKLFTIILVFVGLSLTAQTTAQNAKFATNNITDMLYEVPDSLTEQSVIYDTITSFDFHFTTYQFYMNGTCYPISEFAYNQPNDVYILLIEWSKNKFVNVLYYPNKELVMIKYLIPNTITWYYK